MIHCDEVFDILTRGPFPTGAASDAIVESHLTRCSECRRLAEALRPAIELFQEAVTPEESHALPSYWGDSCQDADPWSPNPWSDGELDGPVEPLPRRRATRRHDVSPARPFAQAAPWAAAVLGGIAWGSWLPTKAHWGLEQTPGQWLREHKVPQACRQPSPGSHAILANPNGGDPSAAVRLACCKGCHADAGEGAEGRVAAKEFLATCVACHQF